MLAEYIELADHLRWNSKSSCCCMLVSSKRFEQNEGLYDPDF